MQGPKEWKGRSQDLGQLSVRQLLVAFLSHPAILTYAFVSLGGVFLAWTWHENWQGPALSAFAILVLYPFVEYGLHRFVLHNRALYKSRWTAALWKRIHFDHHQDPHRLDVLFGSLANTLPTILAIAVPLGWAVAGPAGSASAVASACLIMCVYEFFHCLQHLNYRPGSQLMQRLKRHHLAHHFHDETGNFGITSTLVDHLARSFYHQAGTRPRSETAFNLGYDLKEAARYPWVQDLTGAPPRERPPTRVRQADPT